MTAIDRNGFIVNHLLSVKGPCRVATTANITLSGIQSIDGVTVEADDRVLVKDQTSAIQNGIYAAKTGEWELADDFDQRGHVVQGTRVLVVNGTTNALTEWYVTTTGRPTPGHSSIAFAQLWGAAPGVVLLDSGTETNATSLDIDISAYTGYRALKFVLTGYVPETDNTALHMLTSTDGGSSYDAGASDYAWAEFFLVATSGGTSGDTGDDADSKIQLGSGYGNSTGENANFEVTLYNHTSTTLTKLIEATTVNHDQGGAIERSNLTGARLSTADIDAVRFIPSSGNIASCSWAVYGLA